MDKREDLDRGWKELEAKIQQFRRQYDAYRFLCIFGYSYGSNPPTEHLVVVDNMHGLLLIARAEIESLEESLRSAERSLSRE